MNLIIKRLTLISVFLLPFIIFTRGFYGAVFAKSIFIEGVALIIAILWLIGKLYKKENGTVPKNGVFLAFGLYILILIISCLNGVVPSLSFWSSFDQGTGVVFMLCLFIFSVVISSVFKTIEDWRSIFTSISISGIVYSVGCLLAELGVKFSSLLDLKTQNGFTIGNSSWVGIYLTFVLFISLGLAVSAQYKTGKIIGTCGMLFSFFNPNLSGFLVQYPGMHFGPIGLAQTASYSIIVCVILFVIYLLFRKINSLKIRKIFIGVFLSISIASVIIISTVGLASVRNLIAEKAGPNRLVFWNIALEGFKEKPVLGWGGDSYQYIYAKHFDPVIIVPGFGVEYWVDKSHSIYFDELATGGVLGFLGLMTLYVFILYGLIRKAVLNLSKDGLLYMALFLGIVSFMIQGIMLFQTVIGWFMIAIITAFVSNFCYKDNSSLNIEINNKDKRKNSIDDKGFSNFMAVIILIVFVVLFTYIIAKPYKINRGLSEFPIMSYPKRIQFLKDLDNSYIGNTVDIGNAFSPYHVKLRKIIKNGLKENEQKLMIKEVEDITTVLEHSLERQKDMDMKLLMTSVGYYSILAGVAPDTDRQKYYDLGIVNVNKMKNISDKNPIYKFSKGILDSSLKYGLDGVNAFNSVK